MHLAVAEKGLLVLDCVAKGRAGHAARDEGENAIYKALKDIEILKRSGKYSFEKEQQILENALFYRGMASFDSMIKVKDPNKEILPTPEGKVTKVERKGSVVDIMNNIAGGMRSSYSYCNAKTTKEFQEKVEFGLRMHL